MEIYVSTKDKHKYLHIKNEWAKNPSKPKVEPKREREQQLLSSILQKYVSYSIFIFSVSLYRVYSYSFF